MELIGIWSLIVAAWQLVTKNLKNISKIVVYLLIATLLLSFSPLLGVSVWASVILAILGILIGVVSILTNIVLMKSLVGFYKNETVNLKEDFQKSWGKFWVVFAGSMVVSWLTLGGVILLVIPAIIFYVWFSFCLYFIILENKTILESLKSSKDLVKGNWWKIFWRWVLPGLFYIVIGMIVGGAAMELIYFFAGTNELTTVIGMVINNILSVIATPLLAAAGVILFMEVKKYKASAPAVSETSTPNI
ncbi:MAG: hypothetical protein PHD51_02345 [Patescibacteria group bacterium]|nr:hypothetical protein [Patescibacteria group bacterium]MDD5490299.1 hypothetical protein [Patescibacteria group bacterium]